MNHLNHNPIFKYRLQSADGRVHVANGRAECVRICAALEKQFGPQGYSLLLPITSGDTTPALADCEAAHGYNLPTRPTKTSDSRSKSFSGESVEVDAIPPAQLRRIAEGCIAENIDSHEWEKLQATERLERESLQQVLSNFRGGAA